MMDLYSFRLSPFVKRSRRAQGGGGILQLKKSPRHAKSTWRPPFSKGVISILIICFLFLTSCGFHLRGNLDLPPPLHHLYLKSKDPYGDLSNNLREYLKMSGVYLTNNPADAKTVFVILNENTTQQLLGISGTQQTRQYNLILTVTFDIEDPHGKVLVPPQIITQTRTLTIQSDQILAGSNEANTLYKQMRLAIVYDIMSRLASRDISALLMKNET